ncbi:MAG: hypothetical protein ABIP17_13995 [Ilumatobacteraceae bacterium]
MDERPPNSPWLALPAVASAGAAVIHAITAGTHADLPGLARVFLVMAVAQAAASIVGLVRSDRLAVGALVAVNGVAFAAWVVTRFAGVSFVDGLEVAQRPGRADTTAAVLASAAIVGAVSGRYLRAATRAPRAIGISTVMLGVLMVPGLAAALDHDHTAHTDHADHDDTADHAVTADTAAVHDHADPSSGSVAAVAGSPAPADVLAAHDHTESPTDTVAGDHTTHTEEAALAADPGAWPRPWDPTAPIDFSGVAGVTAEQQQRAEELVAATLRDLTQFADVATLPALGYRSIGDAGTGFEHYISTARILDDKFLDPTAPESLVFAVEGDDRTLVSAMFIAKETPIDDPSLTGFAGPLMQWHVHDNLCWGLDDLGQPVVKGLVDPVDGSCPPGTINAGGENPMVHVWIAPHECGPFAALEGHGAGQASVSDGVRMDQCDHGAHGDTAATDDHAGHAAADTKPYDPDLPIDLGGVDGVTPQQQAFAENLVGATVRDLPQWQDLDAVEAAGFQSIGDAATGHEHYIQWEWIDDDTILDPDFPESLVFETRPDGSKQLVSAMFMMPSGTPLDDVPDFGGALMQWHVHGDLCFTADPVAPRVGGVKQVGTPCPAPLVDGTMSPMIHVWITKHPCGPFAALEGVGGGQVPDGEAILCDAAHGAH